MKKGSKHTDETLRKMSEIKKGSKNSNFGRSPSEETREKLRKVNIGKHHTKKTKLKLSEIHKGTHLSEETRRKMSETRKGKRASKETKKKMSEYRIAHPNRKFKETGIELKVEAELKRRGIVYEKQVPLCKVAIVDFYLPEFKIVIQCDGDYWHNKPGAQEKDKRQDLTLTYNGFNVYRFWEHEIDQDVSACIDTISGIKGLML